MTTPDTDRKLAVIPAEVVTVGVLDESAVLVAAPAGPPGLMGPPGPQGDPGAMGSGSDAEPIADGLLTFARRVTNSFAGTLSGRVAFTGFTAPYNMTARSLGTYTYSTAISFTPTLCRMGLYEASNGVEDLAFLSGIINDPTLFDTVSTRYVRTLAAPVDLVAGKRYAFALLVVGIGTLPTFYGNGSPAFGLGLGWLTPRAQSLLSGQDDLPAVALQSAMGMPGNAIIGEVLTTAININGDPKAIAPEQRPTGNAQRYNP